VYRDTASRPSSSLAITALIGSCEVGRRLAVKFSSYAPPVAARRKRWSGRYIVVWDDGTWEFFRCCRCGNLLEDSASRTRGLGPECKDHAAADEVMAVKNAERERMRAWITQTGRPSRPVGTSK